jgi:hypothetical protein
MIQRQITHGINFLARCSCGREPRHFEDLRSIARGGGHLLECCPCDRRTARFATLDGANHEFARLSGTTVPEPAPQAFARPLRTVRA